MKAFMNEDFLLENDFAQKLFKKYAQNTPIIDYHCHINPQVLAENRRLENLAEAWLGGDHYKWRLMRACGVEEHLITGDADPYDKFFAYASIMPQLIGNPIYHWTHLELQRYFGIYEPLSAQNAKEVYERCNAQLKEMPALTLLDKLKVKVLCTTDDPRDDLRWHKQIAENPDITLQVYPTYRPDPFVNIELPAFKTAISEAETALDRRIKTADELVEFLLERVDFFASMGCRSADHGLAAMLYAKPEKVVVDCAFQKALGGEALSETEVGAYKVYMIKALAKRYVEHDWVMQLHFAALRNVSQNGFEALGPDTGYDAINVASGVAYLGEFLNELQRAAALPRVIAYSLNPADNAAIATILACFQGGGAGRMQHGSAWWFNDHHHGMSLQLTELASNGVLGQFVGMLTDSRSLLSYPRHEYFRRILCQLLGDGVTKGYYPDDLEQVGQIVEDICLNNTVRQFGFKL